MFSINVKTRNFDYNNPQGATEMKKRLLMILVGVMLATSVFAGDAFKYSIWLGNTAPEEAAYGFGRLENSTDEYDVSIDRAVPPSNPADEMDIIVFRSVLGTTGPAAEDFFLPRLAEDYRSTDNDAATWTLDVKVVNTKILTWKALKELGNKSASLEMVLPSGTSVNMLQQTSINNPVTGTYYIKYKKSASVQEAPATPVIIETEMAIYEGGSISFKVLDPSKYEFAGNPSCTIAFFKGEGFDRTRLNASTTDGLVADSATGRITYTFDTSLDYDEAVITYCFRYRSGTRAESTAVAYGSVRAVDVASPIIEMQSESTFTVDTKSEEPGADTCTLSYELIFPSAEPDGRTIDGTHTLVLHPTITVPALFSVVPPDGMGVEEIKDNADGSHSITYSYEATSNGFTLDFILTAEQGAKKGTASLSVACQFPGTQAVTLPEDIATTTATINVKGGANLDIDGSHNGARYVLQDVRLLYNYINRGNSDDTRMLAGTTFKSLTGNEKVAKAAELRGKISDMIDSLDIDDSHAGSRYVLQDVRLIYNYINRGNSDDTRMLAGTTFKSLTGDAKAAKAAELRGKIAAMIE